MVALLLLILALMTVQVLTIDTENPGNGDKPMVTFDPDWRKMFYNETLTLACLGGKGNQTYNWYRHNNMLDTHQQNFTIDSIQLYDRANYQCQVGKGEISDPDRQHIITDLTIIRVPRFVFEGDILNLACDSRMDMNTTNAKVTFYKDSKVLKGTSTETTLYLGKIDKSMSGKYKCSKLALFKNDLKNSDDEEQIEITELFPTPEIQITPNPIEVASDMTLICVARLHPFRANTELEFAFYRNGWHVRGFSPENKFTIRSVTLEDSGDYACEVRTVKSNVRKMSNDTFIQVQALVWPVVTFSPNWDKVLRNDRVTVTCKIGGTPIHRKYSWYKNNNLMPYGESSYSILYAGDGNIGDYQCQTGSGEKSDPLHLDVFFVWLILQVPTNIHEGDSLMIKCRMWNSGSAQNTTFYKDDIMLIFLGTASDLSLGTASKSLNGKYKCTKFINTGSASKVYSAEEFIMVKELFSAPEVQVSPHSMIEGSDMTLTCQTTLSRSRRYEKLQFAFYKNGQLVQAFEESDKYHVQSVQSGDSGNYTCEVQNILKTVKKMSQATPIQIQGMAEVTFTPNVGKIIDGESLTLTCKVDSNMKGDLNFYWYKDNIYINMTRQSFTLQSANVNDSGYYQCRSGVTHISEPLRLDVSNADLILQAPPIINEGEELVLGCHHRNGLDFTNTEFYKDGIFWKILGSDSTIQLGKAYQNVSAVYRCTKRKKKNYSFDVYTAEALVSIKENFPYLKLKVNLEQVREMYDVVLSCEARMSSALSPLRGKTQLQYAFYKDGTSVQSLGPTNTFLISQAKKENSGNYTCQVKSSTNGWTKISQPVSVDVQDMFSPPALITSSTKVKLSDMLNLRCISTLYVDSSMADLQYSFYKDGNVIRSMNTRNTYLLDKEASSGEYSCAAHVIYGGRMTKWSNTTYIMVSIPIAGIQITSDPQDLNMLPGSNVTLKCSVVHGSAPTYTWFHNDKEIGRDCILYTIMHDGKMLLISSTQQHHSGSYYCKASNDFFSSTSKSLQITVKEPMTDLTLRTDRDDLEFLFGESLTFTCSLGKDLPVTYLWMHKGVTLNDRSGLYELKDKGKLLHIDSLQHHHGGSYQCLVVQNVSSTNVLKLQSNTLNISILDKSNRYLVPLLIVVVMVVIIILAMVYKYRHRISLPRFKYYQEKFRVSLKQDEDGLLSMDHMDSIDRFSNPTTKI